MKREDGFYWCRIDGSWVPAEWGTAFMMVGAWYYSGRYFTDKQLEVGERVQRNSDLVKQRDELVEILREIGETSIWPKQGNLANLHGKYRQIIARIEAAKSGVMG